MGQLLETFGQKSLVNYGLGNVRQSVKLALLLERHTLAVHTI